LIGVVVFDSDAGSTFVAETFAASLVLPLADHPGTVAMASAPAAATDAAATIAVRRLFQIRGLNLPPDD
jgi:hypothetical protein